MAVPIISNFSGREYESSVARGAQVLSAGELVVLPTETVYGAAGLLTRADARERLAALRGDGGGRPFTIHLARPSDAYRYLDPVSEFGERLIKKLWPGPVGLLFDVSPERRRAVASQLGVAESEIYDRSAITLRCPDHFVASDVIAAVNGPVVLTTAGNTTFGSSWRAEQMAEELAGKVA